MAANLDDVINFQTEKQLLFRLGYSMIELIVVMGIITTLFGIVVVGFRGSQGREELIAAQRMVIGDLKSAQAKAVSGLDAAGYGVKYVEPDPGGLRNTYKIVAYRFDTLGADCGGVEVSGWTLDCPDEAGSCSVCKVDLKTVSLSQISLKVEFWAGQVFNVYFFRPPSSGQARLLLPDDQPFPAGGGKIIQVVLQHDDSLEQKALRIDTSGKVAQIEPMASPVPTAP